MISFYSPVIPSPVTCSLIPNAIKSIDQTRYTCLETSTHHGAYTVSFILMQAIAEQYAKPWIRVASVHGKSASKGFTPPREDWSRSRSSSSASVVSCPPSSWLHTHARHPHGRSSNSISRHHSRHAQELALICKRTRRQWNGLLIHPVNWYCVVGLSSAQAEC